MLTQISADAPDELRLAVETEPGCAPLDYCILTATMGNKARTRRLWLRDGPVSSLKLYPDYTGPDFAPQRFFGLDRLPRVASGDRLVAVTTDEQNPAAVQPFGRPYFWDYRGTKVTQYWRKAAATVTADLQCVVNGRFTYWGSKRPIPGGIAFENFELQQKFREGDEFIFGVTSRSVAELIPTEAASHGLSEKATPKLVPK